MKTLNCRYGYGQILRGFAVVALLAMANWPGKLMAQNPPACDCGTEKVCVLPVGFQWDAGWIIDDPLNPVYTNFKLTTWNGVDPNIMPLCREVRWFDTADPGINGTFQPNIYGTTFVEIPATSGEVSINFIWVDENDVIIDCDCDDYSCPEGTLQQNKPAPPDPVVNPEPPVTEPRGPGNPDPCQTCGGRYTSGDSSVDIISAMLGNGPRMDFSGGTCYAPGGCGDCAGSAGGGTNLPAVSFQRILIPNNQVVIGNSSPGVFYSFDQRLQIFPNGLGTNKHAATFFDPVSQFTFYYEDLDNDGTYEAEQGTHFGSFTMKDGQGVTVTDPTLISDPNVDVFVVLTRHNGWEYRFELVDAPVYDAEPVSPLGRLTQIKTPQGKTIDFTYKSFTAAELEASPRRRLQIDTISDGYNNLATITYNPAQQAGRWVISNVNVNSGQDTLEYLYNSNGHLETVKRNSVIKSSYTYGTDTQWQAATISWVEEGDGVGDVETLYLSQDYREWDNQLVNQYSMAILGRGDGANNRYMSVSRDSANPGMYRIFYRGKLIEWSRGASVLYYTSFTQNGSGYHSYSGTAESTYAHHPSITAQQVLEAKPPTLVSATGYTTTQTYDANGNPAQTNYPDGTYELRQYNSVNAITYFRNRGGFVTLTEYDANYNVVRIARGLKDVSGPGSETAEPEAVQKISGYYPAGHQNEGLLHWTATVPYAAGAVVKPPADQCEEFLYDTNNRLVEVHKPTPEGQVSRPIVKNEWTNGKITTTRNEHNQPTVYDYDALGRLKTTTHPDTSTEQIYRDTTENKVYHKDRNDVVRVSEFDDAGRISQQYQAYAVDANLFDGTVQGNGYLSMDTLSKWYEYTRSQRWYISGRVQPWRTKRSVVDTINVYDYRGRLTNTKTRAHTGANAYVQQITNYVDNLIFCTENRVAGYVSREYIGRSQDQLTVRKIGCKTAGVQFADNAAVMAAIRQTALEPTHRIVDAVRDVRGNLVQTFDGKGIETRRLYDALGREVQSTSAFGKPIALTTSTEYNARGQVTKTTDAAGTITVTEYDPAGNVKSRKLAQGTTSELTYLYEYHIDGRRKKETLPSTGTNEYDYVDCCGHMRGTKDSLGHGTISNADARGQTVHQAVVEDYASHTNLQNPLDAKTISEVTSRFRSDGKLQFRTVWKSARGQIDPANPPIAGIDGVAASEGVTTQYAYLHAVSPSIAGSKRVRVDRLGGGVFWIDISAALDVLDDPVISGGAGVTFGTDYLFEARAAATVVISPDEKTMSVSIIDGVGRPVMNAVMSGPAAATGNQLLDWSCVQYDQAESLSGFGTVLSHVQVDRDGKTTRSATDGFGLNVASWDQDNHLTRTKFDSAGLPVELINAMTKTTLNEYDDLGRLLKTTNPLGHEVATAYDPTTGRVTTQTDARTKVTTFDTYDSLGRVRQVTDRMGKVSYQDYDTAGRLSLVTDAEGNVTSYGYDLMGRRKKVTLNAIGAAAPQETDYDYDAAGRLERVILHSGEKRELNYEFSGVLDKVDYFNSGGTLVSTDDFSYNDPGTLRRTGSTSSDGVTHAYTYTDRGQLDTDTTTYSGQSYVVDYGYDLRGRLEQLTYPSGRLVDYGFTPRSELDTVKWDGTQIEDRTYDPLGRLTNVDRAQVDETRIYDDANRLQSVDNTNLGTAAYVYDENNNKLSETWTGVLAPQSFTTQYASAGSYPSGYDEEDRFRRYRQTGLGKNFNLGRSHIGNVTNRIFNGVAQLRTFNEVHQLTDVGGNAQTYDVDGSLATSHNGTTLNWQPGNGRLDSVNVPTGSAGGIAGFNEYGYSADAKRIWKKITRGGSVAEHTVYIYAGPNCIAEYDAGVAATTPDQEYVYGLGIDSLMLIAHNNNSQRLTVLRNQQWSVSGLMNTTDGSIAELYGYDVFGTRTIYAADGTTVRTSSSYDNPYGYTARRHDDESGLMYYRARYFDSETGEFVSQDPLEYVDGASLYRGYFVPSDIDPLGLDKPKVWTSSGINNWKGGAFNDYVSDALNLNPDVFFGSKVGTAKPYLPGNAAASAGGIYAKGTGSEHILDKEAVDFARTRKKGELCRDGCEKTKVEVLLIAPKTTTIPEPGCCDVSVYIFFSPWDSVPNQGARVGDLFGRADRHRRFWEERAVNGTVIDVNTNFTPGYTPVGDFPHHNIGAFIGSDGTLRNTRLDRVTDAKTFAHSLIERSDADYVFVGHSQGTNILLHVLNQVCNKKGVGVASDGRTDE